MSFAIRPYHPSDLYAVYRICLLTGVSGNDASDVYRDHELLGHCYAAPYAVFEPDLCFILTHNGAPCGYILGTRDSAAFADRCERDWFPILRTRYPLPEADEDSPDARLIRRIHGGQPTHPELDSYPAHLHIDILPVGQGQGLGHQLMDTMLDQMRSIGIPAVHLGVATNNHRAVRFYERVGFSRLRVNVDYIVFGMNLAQNP